MCQIVHILSSLKSMFSLLSTNQSQASEEVLFKFVSISVSLFHNLQLASYLYHIVEITKILREIPGTTHGQFSQYKNICNEHLLENFYLNGTI